MYDLRVLSMQLKIYNLELRIIAKSQIDNVSLLFRKYLSRLEASTVLLTT